MRACMCVREKECEGVCVCWKGGLRRGRPRNGTRIGRKTLAGMGGPLGGPEGLEAGLEGWGRVRVWRGLGGRDWDEGWSRAELRIGSRGGMGAGIKMKRGRGQGARKRVGFGDGRPGRTEK